MDQQTKALLYCLAADTSKINLVELRNMSNGDWETVMNASIKHGVAPLLYQRLKAFNSEVEAPGKIIDRLHDIYFNSAARNMRLFNELSKVLRILQDDGISVIVLKGAHLAEIVYDNIALRPMDDVDLMVKKADLPEVAEIFLKMGYNSTEHINIKGLSSAIHKPNFIDLHKNNFDIHWTINIDPFKIDDASLWEKAQSVTIAGVKVLVLAPEDLLLYLAVHASFHHVFFYSLKSLCDISQTIWHYQDKMDWEQLQLRAKQWGVDKCLYLTLYLTNELLGASIPGKFLDALKPCNFDASTALAKQIIFDDNNNSSQLSFSFSQLLRYKRFQDKAKFFLKTLFPPLDAMASMYSVDSRSLTIYRYYAVHLKNILLRNGRDAWKLLCCDKKMVTSVRKENTLRDWLTSGCSIQDKKEI